MFNIESVCLQDHSPRSSVEGTLLRRMLDSGRGPMGRQQNRNLHSDQRGQRSCLLQETKICMHRCVYVYALVFATLSLCSCCRSLLDITPKGIFSRSPPTECTLQLGSSSDASDLFPAHSFLYRMDCQRFLPRDASPHCTLVYSSGPGAFTAAARGSGRRIDHVSPVATSCLYTRVLSSPHTLHISQAVETS
jgi:hypothetical protein